ncbi:hypothetical protein QSV34_04485 [Porticoccus sp. W117]|uniref:hypothetical protein n=1 Tax=Porticoccus sp. W117 TaxID=3054777 RepID=UPI002595E721|nr:hypothetical protein [Porticoccus sp. W117]MDM3870602.1 hypothetical protein [Porticoccus sp. W117]
MNLDFIRQIVLSTLEELKANIKLCLALSVVVMSVCLLLAAKWPNTYKTTALIQADRKSVTTDLLRGRAAIQEIAPVNIAEDIIRSRLILTGAAKELGIIDEKSSQYDIDEAINGLSASFETEPLNNNLLRISLKSQDPQRSYSSLNTLIDSFINSASQQKQNESLDAYNFINSEAQKYKAELEAAEKKLSNFKKQNMDGTESGVSDSINELRADLDTLVIDIDETKTKVRTIKGKLNKEREYQKAKVKLAALAEQRTEMQRDLDELLLIGTEKHPDIILLRSQLATLDEQITQLQKTVPGSFNSGNASEEVALFEVLRRQQAEAEVNLQGMQQRQRSLKTLLTNEQRRAERIASNQAELAELTRDYDTTKQIYEEMLERRQNADLSASISREGKGMTYRLRESPVLPLRPSGLQARHFIFIGPLLAIFAPIGLMLVYVYLDPRIRNGETLSTQLPEGIELLGSIPAYQAQGTETSWFQANTPVIIIAAVAILAYGYSSFLLIMD